MEKKEARGGGIIEESLVLIGFREITSFGRGLKKQCRNGYTDDLKIEKIQTWGTTFYDSGRFLKAPDFGGSSDWEMKTAQIWKNPPGPATGVARDGPEAWARNRGVDLYAGGEEGFPRYSRWFDLHRR